MASDTQHLNPEQKELVAVGASIGAGCHPCVTHHLKAGAQVGLEDQQLLAAITSAERVTAEAAVLMGDHVRTKLDVSEPALLSRLNEALASFGAALGANDAKNIERQMRAAVTRGASRPQLQQAIETAKTVQENASRIHVREAERLLDSIAVRSTGERNPKPNGGCGGDDETDPTPVAASSAARAEHKTAPSEGCGRGEKESAAAPKARETAARTCNASDETEANFGFMPPMAECFGSAGSGEGSGPAAIIAHCKQMFGGPFGEFDRPAKTEEPPAATAAKGCSGTKEV